MENERNETMSANMPSEIEGFFERRHSRSRVTQVERIACEEGVRVNCTGTDGILGVDF